IARRLDRGRDRFEILLVGAAERDAHMVVPALGDEADRIRARLQHRSKSGIVRRRHAGAFGHTESHEFRPLRALLLEKLRIGRIGAWIAALDIVEAELVQQTGDDDLVLDRKIDAGRLLAITESRVVEVDALAFHALPANLSVA